MQALTQHCDLAMGLAHLILPVSEMCVSPFVIWCSRHICLFYPEKGRLPPTVPGVAQCPEPGRGVCEVNLSVHFHSIGTATI